jgi:hypothetical protein
VFVLIGLAGLAIDVLRAYDLYAHEERAAEAGALAGVIYMPNFYNTNIAVDNNSAKSRALQEVQKNGFGTSQTSGSMPDCDGASSAAEVTVCKDTAVTSTALQVTVNEPISVFLLAVVGVQSFTVSATSAADFLDVNVLGSNPGPGDRNTWGDGGSSNPKNFLSSINGPGEFKEMGDPFVYCEDGSSNGPPADGNMINATAELSHTIGSDTTDAGFVTNHDPYTPGNGPLCGTANPDQQPPGFTGEATKNDINHPGAYNFAIKATAGDTVWIYNPPFSANDPQSSCNGSQVLDAFMQDDNCTNYYTSYGPINNFDGIHFDDPRMHFDVTYSLYRAQSLFTRTADTLVASRTFHPMDQIGADLAAHSCGGGAYNLTETSTYTHLATGATIRPGVGCVATPTSYTWQPIGTVNATDTYRLAVEATPFVPNSENPSCAAYACGWGRHSYAIAVCSGVAPPAGGLCPGAGLISGWNNFDLYLNFPSANKDIYVPVAYIPSTYAGRTVILKLFDIGDSHGHGDNAYFMIVPPDPCIAINYPVASGGNNWVRTANYGGTIYPTVTGSCRQDNTSIFATRKNGGGQNPSDDLYNGLWIPITFQLPSDFAGGQFWLDEFSNQGKNFDQWAVSAQLAGGSGSPVHLIF